jgi:cytochrome c oxidase subunit 4
MEKRLREILVPNVVAWVVLMVLLGITAGSAFIPLGSFNSIINVVIAVLKALTVAIVFMSLKRPDPLLRLTAVVSFVFLVALFVLTFADYLSRAPAG